LTLEENAILSNNDNQVVGLVKGVDSNFVRVIKVDSLVVAGNPWLFKNNAPYAWLGEGLFYKLNLGTESKWVDILAPGRENTSVSNMEMMEDNVNVAAVIRPGDEMDQKLMVTDLGFARDLFDRQGKISAVEIKITNTKSLNAIATRIQDKIGNGYFVRNRQQQNQAVYKMFNTEKWVAFSIMAFVLLIISFNLIGALSMLVIDKKRDRDILSAMGMRNAGIHKVFFGEGVFVAMAGSLIGLLGGVVVVLLQQKFGFIQTNATFVSAYPVELRINDLILVLSLCLAMGISVSIYPSWKSLPKQ
jgi:lipoprotein-releasing system permease protein